MNVKRVIVASLIGLLAGIFCAYGTESSFPGMFSVAILTSIVYNRVLIGFVIGLAENIQLRPILRGALLGAIVGLGISLASGIQGGVIMLVFSVIYGVVIDVITTQYVK
ncbi:MAG: hypothetical protein V1744_06910 [Candidatus Altiarchaeota archaeon]